MLYVAVPSTKQEYVPSKEELELLFAFEKYSDQKLVAEQGLEYIAGYVAYRFKDKYKLGEHTKNLRKVDDSWIFFISKGYYMYPSANFLNTAKIMDEEFARFHGELFSKEEFVFNKLTKIVMNKTKNEFPEEVIHCLVRTRTYIRLKHANKQIQENNTAKKREKKLSKTTNVKKHKLYDS